MLLFTVIVRGRNLNVTVAHIQIQSVAVERVLHLDSLPQPCEVLHLVTATVCFLDIRRLGSFEVDIVIFIVQILALNETPVSLLFASDRLELDQARLSLAQIVLALHVVLTLPLSLESILHHQACIRVKLLD